MLTKYKFINNYQKKRQIETNEIRFINQNKQIQYIPSKQSSQMFRPHFYPKNSTHKRNSDKYLNNQEKNIAEHLFTSIQPHRKIQKPLLVRYQPKKGFIDWNGKSNLLSIKPLTFGQGGNTLYVFNRENNFLNKVHKKQTIKAQKHNQTNFSTTNYEKKRKLSFDRPLSSTPKATLKPKLSTWQQNQYLPKTSRKVVTKIQNRHHITELKPLNLRQKDSFKEKFREWDHQNQQEANSPF